MKNKILLISLVWCLCIPSFVSANTFKKVTIDGITFQNVIYDINSTDYKLHVATSDSETNIDDLAKANNAITGINGIFFCPKDYTECKWKSFTINERIVDGVDYSFYPDSGERGIFWWDKDWVPLIHQTNKINPELRDTIFNGMGNFPILYANWISQLEHYHDVGLYDAKMSASMKRHFICSTQDKKQIFFWSTSAVSLDNLAPALYELWCWDGINLDAGYSTQYLYNGRRLEYSGRNVLDGFVIERVWLDVDLLGSQIDTIMKKLSLIYKRYPENTAVSKIDEILKALASVRTKIYEENSIDLYDENWNISGYEIDITSLPILKRVYLINQLERWLQILKKEVQN